MDETDERKRERISHRKLRMRRMILGVEIELSV